MTSPQRPYPRALHPRCSAAGLTRLVCALFLAHLTLPHSLTAQTVILYGDGEARTTGGTTTAANPLELQVATDASESGLLDGTGSITKTGAGTLTISSSNYYNGGTTLQAGTVIVSGFTGLGSGDTTVKSGATLQLDRGNVQGTTTLESGGRLTGGRNFQSDGNLNNVILQNGAILSPGGAINSSQAVIDVLTFQELTINAGSILEIDVRYNGDGGYYYDQLNATAFYDQLNGAAPTTLTINGDNLTPITLRLRSLNGSDQAGALAGMTAGHTYELNFLTFLSETGTGLSFGQNLVLDTTNFNLGDWTATYELTNQNGIYALTFTPVPEPSTYALLALGLGVVVFTLRRKK